MIRAELSTRAPSISRSTARSSSLSRRALRSRFSSSSFFQAGAQVADLLVAELERQGLRLEGLEVAVVLALGAVEHLLEARPVRVGVALGVAVNLSEVPVVVPLRPAKGLEPLLRASDAGRALFLTSGVVRSCRPYWGVYSASKAALEAIVRTWAGELRQTSVKANLLNPGPLRTHMRAPAMPGEDPETLAAPDAVAADIVRMLSPDFAEAGILFDFPTRSTEVPVGQA